MKRRRVKITGIGPVTPALTARAGLSTPTFWVRAITISFPVMRASNSSRNAP